MQPSPDQIERAAAALLPFVSAWKLSLNPEDIDELAHAVLSHFDSDAGFDAIVQDVEHRLDDIRKQRKALSDACAAAAARLDGFVLQQALDAEGHKVLARMVLKEIDMPWFICTFEPTHYFEEFRGAFDEQDQAIEAEDWGREERIARALDRAGVRLQRLAAPELPTSEFLLRIDGEMVRVRYEPDEHSQLLDPEHYAGDQTVLIEAHRGSRRASVRREHELPELLAVRLGALGRIYELTRVGALDPYGQEELDQAAARELAHELDFLKRVTRDPLLDPHIAGLRDLADFCWQTDDPAWLTILGL